MFREPSAVSRVARWAGAVLAALALAVPAAAAERRPPVRYAALGDSAAAAPGVPWQKDARCRRSDHNYPSLVAAALRAAPFTDATCTGATTADLAETQVGAVRRDTTLVTLTVGGNDVGFASVVARCSTLGLMHPAGTPCRDAYVTEAGDDELGQRIAATEPKVTGVLRLVHRRAPHARVLLVGYPRLIPDDHRGCRPRELFADADLPYLDRFENRLNAMLRRAAADGGAVFVDNHRAGATHDLCRPAGVRWAEAIVPTSPALPFHPNALGERAMAGAVLRALRGHPEQPARR